MPTAGVEREPALRRAPVAVPKSTRTRRVALIGNPNTGKTTLFNRLCGTRAKTSNFPGTTTSARVGRAVVGGDIAIDVIDLPGLYRLNLDLPEARVARDVLAGSGPYAQPDGVVVVVDACNLTRNLVLTGELLAYGLPIVVALNMVDLAQRRGLSLDPAKLSAHLGCPVIPVVARRGLGLDGVRTSLGQVLGDSGSTRAGAVGRARSHGLGRTHRRRQCGWRVRRRIRRRHADRASRQDLHPSGPWPVALRHGDGWAVLHALCPRDRANGFDRGDVCRAWRARRTRDSRRARAQSRLRRDHWRHRRHGGLPAADLPAVLLDQPARGHGLPRTGGVRDGPAAVPVRIARSRVRAAAHVSRVRAAGHHVHAPDSRSPRSFRHDPGRPVHELFGAPARVRAPDLAAVHGPATSGRSRVRRVLRARRVRRSRKRVAVSPYASSRRRPADDSRAAVVQVAVAQERARGGEGSGARISEDGRHGHHGDLHRHVVAEHVSARRSHTGGRGVAGSGRQRGGLGPGRDAPVGRAADATSVPLRPAVSPAGSDRSSSPHSHRLDSTGS